MHLLTAEWYVYIYIVICDRIQIATHSLFCERCELMGLSEEVHDNYVQNDVGQNEVGKSSFRRNAEELRLVLRIGLQSEAH